MINLTKFSLKRPVTIILCLVTLLFFGLQSILGSKLELTPEMEMPMMVVSTAYIGASPQDMNDLISREIEDAVSTLESIDSVMTYSMENMSIVLLQYEYGTNMDKAYTNLKKAMDRVKPNLPEETTEPNIIEMDMNAQPVMYMAVSGGTDQNLYNYVDNDIVPEFEKLSSVGSVSLAGGRESYIKIKVNPELLSQYGLTMSTVGQLVGAADFTIPAGTTEVGKQSLSVSVGNDYDRMEQLESIVIPLPSGDIIHLSDIAEVTETLNELNSIGRYNGQDTVSISIMKQQSSSAVDVSRQVTKEVEALQRANPKLEIDIISDASEMILGSIESVFQTLLMAIALSMIILFIFLGDLKASVIVGSSIPVSVFLALILMSAMGFSLNVISLGSLVLGVGMMVDNSIVVLESCFRAKEGRNFYEAALEGAKLVMSSVSGSTATTCVVFIPLALLQGLSGQLFRQLGFTIVFCMVASLFSAATVVPLCYTFLHPKEKEEIAVNLAVRKVQNGYRKMITKILPKKKTVFFTAVALLAFSVMLAGRLGMELMPSSDDGTIAMTIQTRPGLTVEAANEVLKQAEQLVANDEDVEKYLLTFGASGMSISSGNSASLTAYLKDERSMETDDKIRVWKEKTNQMVDCTITMENQSSTGMSMSSGADVAINLQGVDYDKVKDATDELVLALKERQDITKVHSSIENAAPLVKVDIDPALAQAESLTPAVVGRTIYDTLSGIEVMDLTVNGKEVSVKVEFGEDEYDSIEKMEGMMLATPRGTSVMLSDIADIYYEDSPQSIVRADKQYQVSISAYAVEGFQETAADDVKAFTEQWQFPLGVNFAENEMDEMMMEELMSLAGAIGTAVFLIFIVMAMQFESPKFSLMVMFTIPFSLIGAFGLLYIAKCKINMVSMLGFLMMIGTVVNNGILYVDTVNQLRTEMPIQKALAEAGAIRLRPILMTTLTTVISMVPMCFAYGDSGEMLQGLALVNVGGLIASTVLALIFLPTFYLIVDGFGRKKFAMEAGGVNYD